MRHQIIVTLSLLVLTTAVSAQNTNSTFASEEEQVSYAIGYNIGLNLKRSGYEVEPDIIARAITDVLEDKEPGMTENAARQVLQAYQQKLFKKRQEEQAAEAAKNKEAGAAWLAENAKKEGVVTLDSGLQYEVLSEGNGDSVGPRDSVKVHYRGTLIDGTEFDSSYNREQPAIFRVTGVIRGWTEALQMMKVGDKWRLFVPSDLAYGDSGRGPKIPPGSTLIFDIELLGVIRPEPVTSDIIKVPSAEEMKRGAKIETIKASDLKRLEEEARKAKEEQ